MTLLEQLSTLLERLSWSLPQFQHHFNTLRHRRANRDMPRVVTLLAFLYADVLELIQEAIEMMCPARRGKTVNFQIISQCH